MSRPTLNRHVMLEHETQTPDGAGGYLRSWETLGGHWADIQAGSGREAAGHGTHLSRVSYKITLRAAPVGSPSRPIAGQRFRGHGKIYAIQAVADSRHGPRYLTCNVIEETVT